MAKVSNVSTESAGAVTPRSRLVSEDPNRVVYATDSNGRRIGARKLHALDMFELTLLLGEFSGNQGALNQAMMASSVVEIGGRQVARPLSMLELRARIAELDFPGYLAAAAAVGELDPGAGIDNVDAIKN